MTLLNSDEPDQGWMYLSYDPWHDEMRWLPL
jgi:hypothetical protein